MMVVDLSDVISMAQLTDKRMFIAVSSLATPDAHGPSHHEREEKPIGRRYRPIEWLKNGKISVPIKAIFGLDEIQQEHREYASSPRLGSIVIRIRP